MYSFCLFNKKNVCRCVNMPFMLAITNDQLAVLMEVVSHMISCTHVILLLNQVKNLVTRVLR